MDWEKLDQEVSQALDEEDGGTSGLETLLDAAKERLKDAEERAKANAERAIVAAKEAPPTAVTAPETEGLLGYIF